MFINYVFLHFFNIDPMKKITLLLVLLSMMTAGFSQIKLDYTAKPKSEAKGFSAKGLSASSAQFLCQLYQAEATVDLSAKESAYAKLQRDYNVVQGKVPATIELAAGQTPQDLAAYGVSVGSVSGTIVTAMIPVGRFVELAESGICRTLDMGKRQHLMMDHARENLGIDLIHAGTNLPQGYDGSGVVVGVIDIGFEYCHPAFYDVTGAILRVKKVWNQKDSTGTAPSGFSYGSEYTTEAQMMAARTDDTMQTHGTHVTSIAAGCGAPSGNGTTYKGIAPGADIVLVPAILQVPNILDAINYIHAYAQSVGKPCVINMSFGSTSGPHDGTAEEDRFVASLIAQNSDSLVLVASAGNSGADNVHIEKDFSAADSLLVTRVEYDFMENKDGEVDIWGYQNYSVAVSLVNTGSGEQVDFTGFFSTGTDTTIVINLLTNNNDSLRCTFKLSGINPYNNCYNANIKFDTTLASHQMILTVRCDTVATIHAWCDKMTFQSTNLVSGTVSGDANYSVGGFGTNTDAVISVGSYNTRLGFTSYNGIHHAGVSGQNMGDISYFSSLGPTLDGRVKPDIAAPGGMIAAACNFYDITDGAIGVYDTTVWNGVTEKYCTLQGTSMSSPMVTGIVALWMQHNPSLGIDSARAILHRTAHNDRYTGSCVSTPNNSWGYGKVNAFGGLPATSTMWLLNAFVEEDGSGCVEGGGVVTTGTHNLTAVPNPNYHFVSWEDGNTDNPRIVNVSCDTTFIAIFSPLGYDDCDTIKDFPWAPEFDDNLTCWKQIDADGDGTAWQRLPASIASMVTGPGAMNTDNWLVSPAIQVNQRLVANITTHCINAMGTQDCSILLSTAGSETEDFTNVLDTYTFTSMGNKDFMLPLDSFQGQTVRIAVRHHNCSSMLASLMIDDFSIEVVQDSVSVPSYADALGYRVATSGLQLNISGAEGHTLQVFDLTGRLIINSQTADGQYHLPSSGVYILRVNGFKPRKVMVVQ